MKQRNKQNSRSEKPKTLSKSPTIQSEVLNIRREVFKRADVKALLLTNQVMSLKKSVFLSLGWCLRLNQPDKGSRTRHFQNKTRQRAPQSTGGHHNNKMKNPHKISMNWMSQDMWIWIWRSGTLHSDDGMFLESFLWNKNTEKCLIKWSLIQL